MDCKDSLLKLGQLSGQHEAVSQRMESLESRLTHSDRVIIEKLDSLQDDLQKVVVDLNKHSSVLDLHRKLIFAIAGITGFGGAGGAAVLQTMGVF